MGISCSYGEAVYCLSQKNLSEISHMLDRLKNFTGKIYVIFQWTLHEMEPFICFKGKLLL
jgi:hypothetical protein